MEVGYVLFGEDYKRGQFLVHLQQEHRRAGNPCGSELADFLPNVLNLVPQWVDPQVAHEFTTVFLIPAVEKMLEGFKENGNVYAGPLRTVLEILKKDFGGDTQDRLTKGVA